MRPSLLAFCLFALGASQASAAQLRVCSDPNNLPFSNQAQQGFENKIAALIARDLHEELSYSWSAQLGEYLTNTIKAHTCDVVMAAPVGLDDVITTRPYYASSYVFVTRSDRRLNLSSLSDSRLKKLRIGMHLIGDEPTPVAEAFGREGIVGNIQGFMIYGDQSRPNPPARLIEAVAEGKVDVAPVWGPLGGYFAKQSPVPLTVTPITGTKAFAPLKFRYAIAIGVREEDKALRDRLDGVLAREQPAIRAILLSYGVPLIAPDGAIP